MGGVCPVESVTDRSAGTRHRRFYVPRSLVKRGSTGALITSGFGSRRFATDRCFRQSEIVGRLPSDRRDTQWQEPSLCRFRIPSTAPARNQ